MQIQRIIEIDAPVESVWSKISNLTDIQNWSATVNEPTITPTFSEDSVPAARAT